MLTTEGLTKSFGGVAALKGVDIAIAAGEVHGLIGENGAGKSTLIKCWAGALRPDGGRIALDGRAVSFDSPLESEHAGLRFIHQELNLVPHFTAVESIFVGRPYPKRFGLIDRAAMRRQVEGVAAALAPGLPLDVPVGRLSPGQRQLTEILRAFVDRARLVVMDEPTASLSEGECRRLFAAIRRLRAAGTSVVYVSHRLEEVLELADTITVLRDGMSVAQLPAGQLDKASLIRLMSGGAGHAPAARGTAASDAAPVLTVRDLQLMPAHSISFDVRASEIVGLYGLMGAGRSTLLQSLFGAARPHRIDLELGGRPFRPRSPRAAIAAGIVFVPEDRRSQGLVPRHSIRDNLTLPRLSRYRRWRALPIPSGRLQDAYVRKVAQRLRARFVAPLQPIAELSGGNQQKFLLGRWLEPKARVLLLDEPTRGVDVGAKAEIHAAIRELAESGTAVLFATSDLAELIELSDRVLVLKDKALVAQFRGAELTSNAVVAACHGD